MDKKHYGKHLTGMALLATMLIAPSAKAAISIAYSVGNASLSIGGDTVALGAFNSSVSLTPGGPSVTAKLNGVNWTVTKDQTGDFTGPDNRLLTITLAGSAKTIQATTLVHIEKNGNSDHQTLTINASTPLVFNFTTGGKQYALTVSALQYTDRFNGSQNQLPKNRSGNLTGQFALTAVPEPTTLLAGALLLLPFGISTLRILRKKSAV
jgi:hypothetical protein